MSGYRTGDAIGPFRVDSVDSGRMRTMTVIMRDPNPIHFDRSEVRRLGLGDGLVNQGPISMGYILTMLRRHAGSSAAVRGLKVRFLGNVFAGDTVEANGTVTAVTRDGEGLRVDCDVWLDRVGHGRVVEGTATLLV